MGIVARGDSGTTRRFLRERKKERKEKGTTQEATRLIEVGVGLGAPRRKHKSCRAKEGSSRGHTTEAEEGKRKKRAGGSNRSWDGSGTEAARDTRRAAVGESGPRLSTCMKGPRQGVD